MGHIVKIDQELEASFVDDVSVWDRVRSLAPSCDPVPGRLFQRAADQVAMSVPEILDFQSIVPVRAVDLEGTPQQVWSEISFCTTSNQTSPEYQIVGDDDDPVVHSIDLLRSRLMPALAKNDWCRVAVVSPEAGSGSSFLACNLAARLSRTASVRTVLMDMNLRDPKVSEMFGLKTANDPHNILTGITPITDGLVRFGENLVLGLADQPAVSPVETLSDPKTNRTLDRVQKALNPDIMLFDMPPLLEFPDMTAFLPQVDAVLLVADGTRTKASHIAECERAISGQANLLGVVLNKARSKPRKSWFSRA